MDVLTFTDTRANLKEVMDRVVKDHAPVVVTRQRAEAVVMVSGVHPVRARKVRYYEDPQFQHRIKPPHAGSASLVAEPDDWSGSKPIAPLADAQFKRRDSDPNGGIRREPELPQHEEVVIKAPLIENEFDPGLDEGDTDALQASSLGVSMPGLARSVSLDPDDEMGL